MDNTIIYYRTLEAANKIAQQQTEEDYFNSIKVNSKKSNKKYYGFAALFILAAIAITALSVHSHGVVAITNHLV